MFNVRNSWQLVKQMLLFISTRTTRPTKTPAFWGYPPLPHDYSYYWVIMDPKSKEDKVKVINLKNLPKCQFFLFWNKLYTWHTLWSCLITCANMKWSDEYCWRYRPDPTLSTDGQTDGQTDKVKPVYPSFNFVEAGRGGIISNIQWVKIYLLTAQVISMPDKVPKLLVSDLTTIIGQGGN